MWRDCRNDREIWKDIYGYEGYYQVSTYGRVRTSVGKNLKPCVNRNHACVYLYRDGERQKKWVHRLVAEAFIHNVNLGTIVNHIDENGLNNRVENLEWCTPQYNTNYGTCIRRRSEKCKKNVKQISLDGKYIKLWNGIADAANRLGIDRSSITKAAKGKRKSAGGFLWRYEYDS